ncbi:MAG: oligosaccharide flippase family protein, partial [Chloroflexota bacterium]
MSSVSDSKPAESTPGEAVAVHLRGSSLLLAGRFVAYGLEFITQILLVRYLTKADYGAFAYALSIIVVLKSIAVLELPNTVGRFIPIYRERQAYGKVMGSTVIAAATVAGVGALLAVGLYIAVGPLGLRPTDDPQALLLIAALGLLIPLEGLDALLTVLFATLTGAAQIAIRQVLAPALKLGLVFALVYWQANTLFLAAGYVGVAALSLLVYALLLVRAFRQQAWWSAWRPRRLSYPIGELFSFALPLLASTVVWALMESSDAVLLGLFQNTEAVANFQAVLPLPRVLATLTLTFGVLYTPLAAQLYARGKHAQVADLYRRVALWMTVLTFPIFTLAFSFARATTTGLYGARYVDSAPVMAVLAVGY